MATFNKFNCFSEDLAEGVHNLGSNTLKFVLTNTAPVATNTIIGNITEISAGNGYTAGGMSITRTSSSQTSGNYSLVLADYVLTASGGSIGPFRYVVIYNDTSSTDALIGWLDYGSSITVEDTKTFTLDFGASAITL